MRPIARARRARGYTAIEVLISLTIVLVGAAGVISMQRAAIQGNLDARRLDAANTIAREWTDRLRANASVWTLPAARNPNDNLSNAALFANVDGAWHRPDQLLGATNPWSPGIDALGTDLASSYLSDKTNASALYCTNVRLTWLIQGSLMRADVRVFWPRGLATAPDAQYCSGDPAASVDTATDKYHFVYATTAIRRNALP